MCARNNIGDRYMDEKHSEMPSKTCICFDRVNALLKDFAIFNPFKCSNISSGTA